MLSAGSCGTRAPTCASAPAPTDPAVAKIDAALWNPVMTVTNAYTDPWDGNTPNEADLHELAVDGFASRDATGIVTGSNRVDVLVHHRHGHAAPADDVCVTVALAGAARALRELAGNTGAMDRGRGSVAAQQRRATIRLDPARSALAVGPGTVPTTSPTGPLSARPTGPVDPRTPRAVTFDLDFTGATPGTAWVVVAVVHSAADPVTLTGTTLQELVLGNHQGAARIVET